MMQAHPVPDVHARGSLAVERMTGGAVALLGAREGTNQIQLCAGIDDPADAAKNSVDLSESAEAIDVNGWQARSLQQKFLVAHKLPRNKTVSSRGPLCVRKLTQRKKNHALASSRFFARDKWSKLNTASHYQFIAPARDEAATVDTLPHLPAAVAATNSSSCGGVESRHASLRTTEMGTGRVVPSPVENPRAGVATGPQDSIPEAGMCGFAFDINSIPDFARRA